MEEYIPVNFKTVQQINDFDLYLKVSLEGETKVILYKKKGSASDDKNLKENISQGSINTFYVTKEDHQKYLHYLQGNLKDILLEEKNNPEDQAKIIFNATENVVYSVFNDPKNEKYLRNSKEVVDTNIDSILDGHMSPHLVNLAVYNHVKYVHAVNCFVLLVFFAKYKGFDESELKTIGLGALLHDIGETQIDPELVKLDRKLTLDERKIIQQHPYLGFKLLQRTPSVSMYPKTLFMVWEHHERWDGNGYPKRLREEEITEYARILGIVDTYNALTTKKSYRQSYRPYEALKVMIKSGQFNKYELHSFISFLGNTNIKIE